MSVPLKSRATKAADTGCKSSPQPIRRHLDIPPHGRPPQGVRRSCETRAVSANAKGADALITQEEARRRAQETESYPAVAPEAEGGVLEILLRELNEHGRLYRESGYLSNAVEKPDDLKRSANGQTGNSPALDGRLQTLEQRHSNTQSPDEAGPDTQQQFELRLAQPGAEQLAGELKLGEAGNTLRGEDADDLDLRGSGDILGEDNMFTGAEELQNKGKARKRGSIQGKNRVSADARANDAVIADFVAQLRDYQRVKSCLSPWISSFTEDTGREPLLADAERTRMPLLAENFRKYMELRSVIFDASQSLRGKLQSSALPLSGTLTHKEVLNANGCAGGRMNEGASRMAKALQYRQDRQQQRPVGDADAAVPQGGKASALEEKPAHAQAKFNPPQNLASASARVKNAMLAAAKYRKQAAAASGQGA